MSLEEFVRKRIGTKIDYDGAFGAQCVDVFRQYCADVLGVPHTGSVEGAKDLFLRYGSLPKEREHFARFSEGNRPLYAAGDVLVWDATAANRYGHVAIMLAETGWHDFLVFEQDGFRQDGARIWMRGRAGLLGCLRMVSG